MPTQMLKTAAPTTQKEETADLNSFETLLSKEFKSQTDRAREQIDVAVQTLAQQALQDQSVISGDSVKDIEGMIAKIDEVLTSQVNEVLHHPDFQRLEGTWRGLHHLVFNTETDEHLKIRFLNINKKEVSRTFQKYSGVLFDQSPLFKKVYEDEFGTPGGTPYGCLVGDLYFNHTPQDVDILDGFGKIAAAAHAPFIAAASSSLMGMETWQELSTKRDITKIFQSPEYAAWRSLRLGENSRYIGLTMPRFLARLPYGSKTQPVDDFAFEEDVDGLTHDKYCWSNSAYAMATNITRSFKEHGWCANIRGAESGGMTEGLHCHVFPTDDGGVDIKCPTEVAITDRREAELAKSGLMPLSHWKNTDYAVFIGAQTLQQPIEYEDSDATTNARLSARMPYMFATARFAHYLKCMVRDKIGAFKERGELEDWLNRWISQYVTLDPNASEAVKAKHPLAEAKVEVSEIPGNPGYYTSKVFLRPHFQLEGLTLAMRLVSKFKQLKP